MFGRGCVLGMGSRLCGNDGFLGAAACWGWVPAFAGMADVWAWLRVGDGFPPSRERRLRVGDGFPPARERRKFGGGCGVGDGFPPAREWRIFGRGCVLGMGSRLGGNGGFLGVAACWGWIPAFAGMADVGVLRVGDGFPPGREWRMRVGDGFPPSRERRRWERRCGNGGGAGGTRRGHCDRHTRGNGYPGARWGCGRGWGVWYTACVSLFVSLFLPGEPTVFPCVLTATAAASRARPPGPSTTVPEAIPEADERSASRRYLGMGSRARRETRGRAGGGAANREPRTVSLWS